jgi:hypothetical protein
LAIQSGVAVANSLAAVARISPAKGIEGQGDLATMNYSALIDQLMKDPKLAMALSNFQANATLALATAASAQAFALKAIDEIAQLKSQLARIAS